MTNKSWIVSKKANVCFAVDTWSENIVHIIFPTPVKVLRLQAFTVNNTESIKDFHNFS